MPRNTREWSRRKVEEAINNLDWAMIHCEDIREVYAEAHPEIAGVFEIAQKAIIEVQNLLAKLRVSY